MSFHKPKTKYYIPKGSNSTSKNRERLKLFLDILGVRTRPPRARDMRQHAWHTSDELPLSNTCRTCATHALWYTARSLFFIYYLFKKKITWPNDVSTPLVEFITQVGPVGPIQSNQLGPNWFGRIGLGLAGWSKLVRSYQLYLIWSVSSSMSYSVSGSSRFMALMVWSSITSIFDPNRKTREVNENPKETGLSKLTCKKQKNLQLDNSIYQSNVEPQKLATSYLDWINPDS